MSAIPKPPARKRVKTHSRKKRTSEIAAMRRELDGLVRLAVIERDKCCVRCGGTKGLQAAHILPKSHYPRLRFDPFNIMAMDTGCHIFFWHKDPLGARAWFDEKYPGKFDQLQVVAACAMKVDLKELLTFWRGTRS